LKAYIPLILFTVLTNFVSQIMLKKGMTSIAQFDVSLNGVFKSASAIIFNPFVFGGLIVMVVLSEPLNAWKIAGVLFIVLGVSLVAQS